MTPPDAEKDYVLGTHDEEIERLGLQHRIWRPRALDAWRRAGLTIGSRALDVGCGPGWATADLGEIVGPAGHVTAVDRSERFLAAAAERARGRGLHQVDFVSRDLDEDPLPDVTVDVAWCRWVLGFVRDPRSLLERIAATLRPGGRLVIHEYFAYETWRFAPPSPVQDAFVRVVIDGWRAAGGEPNIGLNLPAWLAELGFAVERTHPIIDVVDSSSYIWQWPASFVEVGARRYAELGALTGDQADEIIADVARRERDPDTLMVTPGVLEIIARRP